MRIGSGYDVHRLIEGRELFLGGVSIDFPKGLLGHSDGDVVCHAIADALLGAVALGDIGKHFPPGDSKWKGVRGQVILGEVRGLLADEGFKPAQVDVTIVLEEPKLQPFVPGMRSAIAQALEISASVVSVKAKTNEGLGFLGRGEAVAAMAVATVVPWNSTSSDF